MHPPAEGPECLWQGCACHFQSQRQKLWRMRSPEAWPRRWGVRHGMGSVMECCELQTELATVVPWVWWGQPHCQRKCGVGHYLLWDGAAKICTRGYRSSSTLWAPPPSTQSSWHDTDTVMAQSQAATQGPLCQYYCWTVFSARGHSPVVLWRALPPSSSTSRQYQGAVVSGGSIPATLPCCVVLYCWFHTTPKGSSSKEIHARAAWTGISEMRLASPPGPLFPRRHGDECLGCSAHGRWFLRFQHSRWLASCMT